MPFVGITGNGCVVLKQVFEVVSVAVALVPNLGSIEDVAAAIPLSRATRFSSLTRGRLQQVAQRRDGAVMQIRRARPDAVERLVGVAARLAEMPKAPGIASIEHVLRG